MIKTNIIYWIVFLIIAFFSCKTHSSSHTSNNNEGNDNESKRVAMILLNITNSDGKYSTSIVNSKIIETTKDFNDKENDTWRENDFVCFVLDKNESILDTILIFQPLHPRFEYPEDDNTIGSKVIEQKNSSVLLKFSYLSTMKYLRIEKIEEDNTLKLVNILEIPLTQ
jgi:hypothetical protein